MSRLIQLHEFLEEDPNDPFNLYALALEYQKVDAEKALSFFNRLLHDHADYVPTYYHLGKLYEALGEKDNAIHVLEQGITKAKLQNDIKALREMNNALMELQFD